MNKVVYIRILISIGLGVIAGLHNYCQAQVDSYDVVHVKSNAELEKVLRQNNKHYIIHFNHDLGGKSVMIGQNSILDFKGGSFRNGSVDGNATKIVYNKPFFGDNLCFRRCSILNKKLVKDVDVFTEVCHTQNEIQALFDLSGGIPISFSCGTYRDINQILINNDLEADFNGSTVYANVNNKKSSMVFKRGIENSNAGLEFVRIKNLVINGGIDIADLKQKLPENRPTPCIELFYVNDVVLDNVDITQFNTGTEDRKNLTPGCRDAYEHYLVAIMYGLKAKVANCDISYCVNEGFKFAPKVSSSNFIEFSNNSSKNRFWTLLEVDDARCLVKNNVVEGTSSSAFNLFCYDSEVCNNIFRNGIRGAAIDLSEPANGGALYRSYNVSVHDNECYNYPQLLEMWAGKVDVYNNYIDGTIIPIKNSAGCIVRMLNKYTESNERTFKAPFNNPGGQDDFTKDIQLHDNIFDGEFKAGIICGNRLSERTEGENVSIWSNQFLDTKSKNPDYYPILLFCVKNISVNGNKIGVLKHETFNSTKDNAYFYCDRCTGTLDAINNKVTKEVEKDVRYVFSIASSQFDKAIVKDDSKHGFLFQYKTNKKNKTVNQTITTNCSPYPGIRYGREVKFIK